MTTGSDGRQLLLQLLVDEGNALSTLQEFNQLGQQAAQTITTLSQPPQLDLSALQSQIDQLSSQFGDLNAAAELNTESLTNFGATTETTAESLTNLGSTTETTTEQVAGLGSASEQGAQQTRAHGQAAGEAASEFSAFGQALGDISNIIPGLNGGLSQGGSLLSAFSQEAEEGQSHLALVGAGVAAIGVGIAGLSFEAFDHGVESIHLLSEETGMSTEAVGGFQLSLQEAGLSGDAANSSLMRVQMNLQSMINQIDQGKTPTGNFSIALQQLGISADDVQKSGGDLTQLMPEIADAFQRQKAQADASGESFNATGLAMQIFGRSGAAMVPVLEQGSAALQANADYVRSLGLANDEEVAHLEAWNTAEARAQLAAEAFGASIGSDLAPMMTSAATLVGNATAAFDQLPGPIKDATVTLPLLAGAGLSAAAGVGKLFDLMGSGVDVIKTATSTVASAAQATVAWATSLDAEAVSAGTAATAETSLATAESAAGAGAVGAGAAATAMDAQGASAPNVEAAAVAEEHLATAEGAAGAGGVVAGAGATTAATGVSGFLGQLGAALGPIGVFTALVGGGIAIEAKFKDQIDSASGSLSESVGGLGLMSAGINGLVDHLNGGASPALDQLSDHLSTGKGGFDAITASANANATATDADTQELKKLDSALGLTGAAAQSALPFLQQFITYEDQVGGDALTAAKGVDTLSNSLNSMSAVLNEHLSTGATGEAGFATLDKQIDNTTKVLGEEQKAAADAAQGNTALSQAEYALADAYRAGDAVAIAKANQMIALLPPTKDLTDATLAGIAAQKDDASGKTASADAERALQAAYESGDPARVKAAEDTLKIAQANDSLTTATGKTANTYQQESDAAAAATAKIGQDFATLDSQLQKDSTDVATALGQIPQRSVADWQQVQSTAQTAMSGLLAAVQSDIGQIEGLEQQLTGVMSAEDRKRVQDSLTAAQDRLKQDQSALDADVKSNSDATTAIQKQWTGSLTDYDNYQKTLTTLAGVTNDTLLQGQRDVTKATLESDQQQLDSARDRYTNVLTLEGQWQNQLLTDQQNGDADAQQFDQNMISYLNDIFIGPAKTAYDSWTSTVKSDNQQMQSDWQNSLSVWQQLEGELIAGDNNLTSITKSNLNTRQQAFLASQQADLAAARQKYDSVLSLEEQWQSQELTDLENGDSAAAEHDKNMAAYFAAMVNVDKSAYDSLATQVNSDLQGMTSASASASNAMSQHAASVGNAWQAAAQQMEASVVASMNHIETASLGVAADVSRAFGLGSSSSSGGGSSSSSSSGGMGIGTTSIGAAFGSGSGGSSSSSGGSSGGGGLSLFDLGYPITLGYAFDSDYAAGLLSPTGGPGPALAPYGSGASSVPVTVNLSGLGSLSQNDVQNVATAVAQALQPYVKVGA